MLSYSTLRKVLLVHFLVLQSMALTCIALGGPRPPGGLEATCYECALQSETAFIGGAQHKRQKHTFLLLRPNFLGQIYLPHIQE